MPLIWHYKILPYKFEIIFISEGKYANKLNTFVC